jgi:hypothetical protein
MLNASARGMEVSRCRTVKKGRFLKTGHTKEWVIGKITRRKFPGGNDGEEADCR